MAEIEVPRTHEEEEVFEALEELDLSVCNRTLDFDQSLSTTLMTTTQSPRIHVSTPRIHFPSPRAGFDPPTEGDSRQTRYTPAKVNVTRSPFSTPKRHAGITFPEPRNNNLLMTVPNHNVQEIQPERILSPLNTYRLKPISERVKKTGLSITESGTVCMDLYKQRHNIESLVESVEISADGKEITVTQYRVLETSDSTTSVRNTKRKTYTLDSLPQKLHKKYEYARRFVNLVKSKTPKIIMYNKQAKCMLMENFPDPCFMAKFYNGETYLSTWRGEQLVNEERGSITAVTSSHHFDLETQKMIRFAKKCHKQCLQIEGFTRSTIDESLHGQSMFPVILGSRRKAKEQNKVNETFVFDDIRETNEDSNRNENGDITIIDENFIQDTDNYDNDNENDNDNNDNESDNNDTDIVDNDDNKLIIQTEIPNIGTVSQMESGAIWVLFNDGSHIGINPSEDIFAVIDKNGVCHEYNLNGVLPEDVQKKLSTIPKVLDFLYGKEEICE